MRAARAIALAFVTLLVALCTGHFTGAALAGEVTIGFDDLSPGALVTNQYEADGIELGSAASFGQTAPAGGDCGPPTVEAESVATPAVSAPNYAILPPCPAAGPPISGTYGALSHPATSVSVQARDRTAGTPAREVLLVGYDASGKEVASGHGDAGTEAWQPIAMSSGTTAQISYISIRTATAGGSSLAIDDLSFAAPSEPPGGGGGGGAGGSGSEGGGGGGGLPGGAGSSNGATPPTAVLALSGSAVAGGLTTLTGAGSTPGSGRIISYDWDFNDDGHVDTSTGTNPVAQFVLPPGRDTVALTVTNSSGEKSTSKLIVPEASAPPAVELSDGGEGPCEPSYEHEQVEILAECIQTLPGGGYVMRTRQVDLNGMMLVPQDGGKGIFKIETAQRLGVGTYTLLTGPRVSFELLNTPIGNLVLGGRDLAKEPIQLAFRAFIPPKLPPLGHVSGQETAKSLILSFAVGTECSGAQKDATCCPKRQGTACATLPGGFPLGGQINVYLNNKGEILLDVQVELDLSAVNFQATGALEIIADVKTGVNLSSLQFTVPEAGLAEIFKIEKAAFTYYFPDDPEESKRDTWQAKGTIVFGPLGEPKMEGSLSFKKGQFHEASMTFTAPTGAGVPIYPGILVNQLGGTVGVEPLKFGGTIGASIATQLELSLSFLYREAEGKELGFFGGQGKLSYKNDEIATLAADVYSDGYTDAQLKLNLHFPFDSKEPVIELGGEIGFWDEPQSGRWEADGSVHMKLWIINAEVAGLINDKQAAGCLSAFGGGLQGSYVFANGEIKGGVFIAKDCSDELKQYKEVPVEKHSGGFVKLDALQLGPFASGWMGAPAPELGVSAPSTAARAVTAATGGGAIDVPSGQFGEELLIESGQSTPVVSLTSPGGETYATPSSPGSPVGVEGRFISAVAPNPHQVIVLLEHPQGGRWQIAPVEGAPPIAKIEGAEDVAPAKIHVRARRLHGRRFSLAYRISNFVHGMRVQFVERGRDSTRVIATANRARGSEVFTPEEGLSRPRRIYAYVLSADGGAPKRTLLVGRFRAPVAQRGGRLNHLRFVRHRSAAVLSWHAVPRARAYKVRITGSDGRLITRFLHAGQHSLKLSEALPWYSYKAQVRAEAGTSMLPGPAASARLGATGHSPGRPPKGKARKKRKGKKGRAGKTVRKQGRARPSPRRS